MLNERRCIPAKKAKKRKSQDPHDSHKNVDKADVGNNDDADQNETTSSKKPKKSYTYADEPVPEIKKMVTSTPKTINHSPLEISDGGVNNDSLTSKKKSKKHKEPKDRPPPPEANPPSTLFEYFTQHIHTGKPKKAKKAFEKLEKKERKQLKAEYKNHRENYELQLKAYLDSLSEEDAIAYVS